MKTPLLAVFKMLPFLGMLALMGACANLSTTNKATALYGSFVIAEGVGAQLIQSPEIPDAVKAKIQTADHAAKPVGDALYTAIVACRVSADQCSQLPSAIAAAQAAVSTLNQETQTP